MHNSFLWTEKYRPKKIEDTILPKRLKDIFRSFIKSGIPNLILAGGPGVGKTTVARAMLEEVNADYTVINGSLYGGIDTLRHEIKAYASTVSFTGDRKYVILDEADYLNPQSTQPALRNFMEEFSSNCGFILTCNYKTRIIEPLHSRCSLIEFNIEKEEKSVLAKEFFLRTLNILTEEGVEFDKAVVAKLIEKHFPDWRKCLNELQKIAKVTGKIDTSVLVTDNSKALTDLIKIIQEKNFNSLRKWIANNSDLDYTTFYDTLYSSLSEVCDAKSVPQLVLTLADYQYKSAFVASQEINTTACIVEIMSEISF